MIYPKIKHAVQALIFNNDGLVLGVSRKDDHQMMGLPGGKVDLTDLTLNDAMSREIMEETGLYVDMSTAEVVYSAHEDGYMGHTYLIKDWSGDINTIEPHKIEWVNFETIQKGPFGKWNTKVRESLKSMGIKII